MYIILAILIFSILIVVHELGHFLTAKLFGVQVNEFSVFMGPKIFQWKGKETVYSLRCIPLGGYCAMEGENEGSENPRAFTNAKPWKRAVILLAGAAMNFLLGFLLVLCIFAPARQFSEPVLRDFYEGCPYEAAEGFQKGDRIYSINGKRVRTVDDFSLFLSRSGEDVDLVLKRQGEKIRLEDYHLVPVEYTVDGVSEYLYGFYFEIKEADFGTHLQQAWYDCIYFTRLIWMSLGDMVSGAVSIKDVSGPVGIVAMISETGEEAGSTREGILDVLYLGAFIAVNLAVMNLLPIPALDGGRVFALLLTGLIEGITRKKVDPRYEGYIHAAGMLLLLAFMAFVMFQDVFKLIFK